MVRAEDWFTADNPDVLLYALLPEHRRAPPPPPVATARRVRLFCCACARSIWELLPPDARSAVAARERFADGLATEADVRAAGVPFDFHTATVAAQAQNALHDNPHDAARWAAKARGTRAAGPAPGPGSGRLPKWHAKWTAAFAAERAKQAEFVRDIFPPPGHSGTFRVEWRTDTAVAVARQMELTGDFGAVPVLADALQDAGCDDEAALARCRAPSGVHCRGNWVVDLVLGRT